MEKAEWEWEKAEGRMGEEGEEEEVVVVVVE